MFTQCSRHGGSADGDFERATTAGVRRRRIRAEWKIGNLSGSTGRSTKDVTIDDDARTHAGADRDDNKIADRSEGKLSSRP